MLTWARGVAICGAAVARGATSRGASTCAGAGAGASDSSNGFDDDDAEAAAGADDASCGGWPAGGSAREPRCSSSCSSGSLCTRVHWRGPSAARFSAKTYVLPVIAFVE